jgi:hypothetical protein
MILKMKIRMGKSLMKRSKLKMMEKLRKMEK